mmetsp:Transcript_66069/g.213075  ORF Transcript_66069/g.213075 Transcript_66069/m.213075 type:complete len:136 (+) Transcript_66069:379-786(+)
MRGVFYVQMSVERADRCEEAPATQKAVADHSMKGAITTLLDVAEACNARRITLGISHEHAACAELVCSLLYLGFQVAPARKSPLIGAALQLDFEIGWPSPNGGPSSSDQTCTGASEVSTAVDDTSAVELEATDSE